jgi:hypothetical protein
MSTTQRTLPIVLYISILALLYVIFSGAYSWIYERYTIPAVIGLFALITFIAWVLSNVRPAFPGKLLGVTLFYGIVGSMYRRFEALTVEMTHIITDEALVSIKELAINDLDERYKKENDVKKKEQIQKVKDKITSLKAEELRKFIHVYGCRRDFVKHIWVFLSDKPLEQHIFSSVITSFTIPFGFIRRQAVFGIRYDIKGRIKMIPYGKVRVHLFIPLLDPAKVEELSAKSVPVELKDAIAELGSAIRTAMLLSIENKMLRKEIRARERRLKETERQLSEMSKETDIARRAAKSKVLEPLTEEEAKLAKAKPVQARYYELLFSVIGGQVVGSTLIPQFIQMDAFTAGIVGSILGAIAFFAIMGRS